MVGVKQAVVMVGGKGTRLKPLTDNCPKPILPVLDRPCLAYLIDSLAGGGIEHVILACGYHSDKVTETIGHGEEFGIEIEYSYEDEPRGTAGAMKILEDRLDDTYVGVNGDVFADISVKDVIEMHQRTNSCVTISLTEVENPCEFGIARLDDTGRITEFKEKPKPEEVFSNLINAGVYVINKKVMNIVPKDTMYDFSKELVPILMSMGHRIQGYVIEGVWRDVGRPSDLLETNLIMADRRYRDADWSEQIEGSMVRRPFYIGYSGAATSSEVDSAVIGAGSYVMNSQVQKSMIMEGSFVSSSSLKDTIIGKDCKITDSTIVDSVIADGSIIKGRTIISEKI